MVHARDKKESETVIKSMSVKSGVTMFKVQFTIREFKKIRSDLKEILA